MNIWVNGCFDILHSGHIDLLWYAKLYDTDGMFYDDAIEKNILYVGLDSDERVKFLKGDKRPVNDIETRVKIMANFKMVDEVVIFHDDDELRYFIKEFDIDYLVIGDDYRDKTVIGAECTKSGVIYYPKNNKSTTNVINKIQNL